MLKEGLALVFVAPLTVMYQRLGFMVVSPVVRWLMVPSDM